jgi:Cu(I)/Ag(I) efflux system membrane protein CusA/SilA
VYGIDALARQIEAAIRTVLGITGAFAERVIGGYYLNIDPDRAQLARYGLMIGDVQNVIAMAVGADPVTTTVEGRERYTVSIRYPRDYRSDPQTIANDVLIPIAGGRTEPLGQIAKVSLAQGPSSIRTENAQLAVYLYVDFRDRDLGGYVADAQKAVAESRAPTPPGAANSSILSARRRACRSSCRSPPSLSSCCSIVTEALIVMLSVPFALVGGLWLMWALDFNLRLRLALDLSRSPASPLRRAWSC